MLTLSYGFFQPQTGDKGSVFWPRLEDNFQQLNDHTHNGSDSAMLTSASVSTVSQAISSAGWVASGTGFRQLVTMPGAMLFNNHAIIFKESVTKEQMFLAAVRQSANTYYVYINDSSLSIEAFYT